MRKLIYLSLFIVIGSLLWVSLNYLENSNNAGKIPVENEDRYWYAPKDKDIPPGEKGDLIRYGKELIAHTSKYLGPKGSVAQISNGLNCQNCHLDAGTVMWGNNYSSVYSTYPKLRARSGQVEDIPKRVNDCFERSLNGQGLDTSSIEMNALVEYITWIGHNQPKGEKTYGSGIFKLAFLDRAANPQKGQIVYQEKCQSCHMANGEGIMNADGSEYQYPPLWGEHSYNSGAGLYRISNLAGYAKSNMPFGVSFAYPILSDEEAWDVAAFINSQPRPEFDNSGDWPDISKKPIDHPFGPYADNFDEKQHKYGPFSDIKTWKQQHSK
jgi:thiosulfate dehydrogenase